MIMIMGIFWAVADSAAKNFVQVKRRRAVAENGGDFVLVFVLAKVLVRSLWSCLWFRR